MPIDSNITKLSYAFETTLGVLPGSPRWRLLEPNSFGSFGGDLSRVSRNYIGGSRQNTKGVLTEEEAGTDFEHDMAPETVNRLLPSFFFAAAYEAPDNKRQFGDTFNISSLDATTGVITGSTGTAFADYVQGHRVRLSGFNEPGNNKIVQVASNSAPTMTLTAASLTGLVTTASVPGTARAEVIGFSGFTLGTLSLEYDAAAGELTLIKSGAGIFNSWGVKKGQWIWIGGDGSTSQFVNAQNRGLARIKSVSGSAIVFDRTLFTPVDDTGTDKNPHFFFGKFMRNEDSASLIRPVSVAFERQLGSDVDGVQAEYVLGAIGNTLEFDYQTSDKLTLSMGFMALSSTTRTGLEGIWTGPRETFSQDSIFNTATDVHRALLYVFDPTAVDVLTPTPLFVYASDLNFSIDNGASIDRAIGQGLGGIDISTGNFEVQGSGTFYFTDVAAVRAMRNNAYVGLVVANISQDHGFVLDIMQMSLDSAPINVEKDAKIKIDITGMAERHPTFGMTLGYSYLPYVPVAARPVIA